MHIHIVLHLPVHQTLHTPSSTTGKLLYARQQPAMPGNCPARPHRPGHVPATSRPGTAPPGRYIICIIYIIYYTCTIYDICNILYIIYYTCTIYGICITYYIYATYAIYNILYVYYICYIYNILYICYIRYI